MPAVVRVAFASCLVLLVFGRGTKGADDPPIQKLKLIDVFQLEYASDPQISPDGKRVVYVRNFMDIMKDRRRSNLWIIGSDGKDSRPITSGNRNDSSPRWAPDGNRLVYVASEGGTTEVYSRWLDSAQTAKLTQLANEPADLAWSPDGRTIAFTMFVPDERKPYADLPPKPEGAEWAELPKMYDKTLYRADGKGYIKEGFHHVFLLPAEGGTPAQLTEGPYHHQGPLSWSPDGKTLFCSANRSPRWQHEPSESEIFEITLSDKKLRPVTDRKGPDHDPAVSPDGRQIAWLGYDDEKLSYQATRLYVMNRDGTNRRVLTAGLDRTVANPVWSGRGDGLFFQYDDTGTTRIGFASLAGKVTPVASNVGGVTIGRPYASGSFSAARDGALAYTLSRPSFPADVAVVAAGSDKSKRITQLNDDLFGQRRLAEVEEFWFDSVFDKRRIQAWLVKPPGFDATKKYPLLLEIHGGPFANYGDRFSTEIQLYSAAGYVVLYVNPRGSTGYGEEFANLIHHDYPGRDYDDLMSGVDAAIARGFVDPDNLFVTGGSGGGILTAWIVGKTDRFRAAVSAKPAINWASFVLTTDMPPFFTQYWFPGLPWKHAEHYRNRSPLTFVENVTTPTMLITGEEDYRTPISESEQFYQALQLREIDSALVRIPDASHDIVARPSRFMVQVAYTLKWFETHRKAK